jgi:hypothetical protein
MIPQVNENNFQEKHLYLFYLNMEKAVDTFFTLGGLLACWTMMFGLDRFGN